MRRVLFLCTGNSCRSQMAEAIVNARLSKEWWAFSAGTEPSEYVHSLAIRALSEIGIVVGLLFAGGYLEFYMIELAQQEGLMDMPGF